MKTEEGIYYIKVLLMLLQGKLRLNFGFVLSVTCSVCNISYRFNLKFY